MAPEEIAKLSLAALVTLYNKQTGKAVKRFASRADGVKRVLAALGPGQPAPAAAAPAPADGEKPSRKPEKPATPKAATRAAKPKAKPAPARERNSEYVPPKGAEQKAIRRGSKRAQFLQLLQRPAGVTEAQAMSEFGWSDRDVRDVLYQLAAKQGYHTKCDDVGHWRLVS